MKKQGWFILSVLGLVICITSAPAHAQDGKISLFAGYSFGTNTYYSGDPGLHGYTAQAVYNLNKHIGLEANFSGHNGTSPIYSAAYAGSDTYASVARQDLYTYTFGPKLFLPMGHFSLFTHFLVGAAHVHDGETDTCTAATGGSCSSGYPEQYSTHGNGFAFKTGGGVDWNHGFWGVRILEVDYVRSEIYGTETYNCPDCEGVSTYKFDSGINNFELATGVTFNFGGAK